MYRKLNSYLGFTDNINQPRKAKVENILSKLIRYDGVVTDAVTWVLNRILDGSKPEMEENYTYYKRNGEKSKPKTMYKLNNQDEGFFNEISKTEYDLACYIIENGLTNENVINDFLEKEKADKEAKRKEEENKEQLRIAKENKEKEHENKVRKMIDDTIRNLPENEKELLCNIFENTFGYVNRVGLNYELLALIKHFDEPLCKAEIISLLHNDNKASIKVFEYMTGLPLPKTYKARKEYLESITSADFKGMVEYAPIKKTERKNRKSNTETFYMLISDGNGSAHWQITDGKPITYKGIKLFMHKVYSSWVISSVECGLRITSGNTQKEAQEKLRQFLDCRDDMEQKIKDSVKYSEEKAGKNPLFI